MKFPWRDDLIRHAGVDAGAKVVYLTACLEPLSISGLCSTSKMSRNTVKSYIRSLEKQGWIIPRKQGREVIILPTAPDAVQQKHARLLKVRISMVLFRGEAQMKVLLDEIIVSRDFVENARPDFLRSPISNLKLEVDRLYPGVAGFEYEGAQHSQPVAKFGGQSQYNVTRTNDLIKAGMSAEANIQLIRVIKSDLTIEGMGKLIPISMKTWPLVEGPYLRAVRETCAEYLTMDTGEEDRLIRR